MVKKETLDSQKKPEGNFKCPWREPARLSLSTLTLMMIYIKVRQMRSAIFKTPFNN